MTMGERLAKETDKDFALTEITKAHDKSGGHTGILFNDLASKTNVPIEDLKEAIRELCREKKITWYDNVHGKAFKLKK